MSAYELERCTCGRLVELRPSAAKITISATGTQVDGALMGSCSCGRVRLRLPKLPQDELARLKTFVKEGGKTGLSLGYTTPDDAVRGDSSPDSSPPARRPRVGARVPTALRPRRK